MPHHIIGPTLKLLNFFQGPESLEEVEEKGGEMVTCPKAHEYACSRLAQMPMGMCTVSISSHERHRKNECFKTRKISFAV